VDVYRSLLAGLDTPVKILVTTMWNSVSAEYGEQRELDLCDTVWRPMLCLGIGRARFTPFNENRARDIVKQLIDLDTRVALLQEDTVAVATKAKKGEIPLSKRIRGLFIGRG